MLWYESYHLCLFKRSSGAHEDGSQGLVSKKHITIAGESTSEDAENVVLLVVLTIQTNPKYVIVHTIRHSLLRS